MDFYIISDFATPRPGWAERAVRLRRSIHRGAMTEPPPAEPWKCRWCGGGDCWLTHYGDRRCRRCHEPVPGAEKLP